MSGVSSWRMVTPSVSWTWSNEFMVVGCVRPNCELSGGRWRFRKAAGQPQPALILGWLAGASLLWEPGSMRRGHCVPRPRMKATPGSYPGVALLRVTYRLAAFPASASTTVKRWPCVGPTYLSTRPSPSPSVISFAPSTSVRSTKIRGWPEGTRASRSIQM